MYCIFLGGVGEVCIGSERMAHRWVWERWTGSYQRVGLKKERVSKLWIGCHAVHHISLALNTWSRIPMSVAACLRNCGSGSSW